MTPREERHVLKCWICDKPAHVDAEGKVTVSIFGALCRECLDGCENGSIRMGPDDTREHRTEAAAGKPEWRGLDCGAHVPEPFRSILNAAARGARP